MKGFIYKISNADDSIIFIGGSTKTRATYWSIVKTQYNLWLETGKPIRAIYPHFQKHGVDTFSITMLGEHELKDIGDIFEHKQIAINSHECVNANTHDFRIGSERELRVNPKYDPKRKIQCGCGSMYNRYNEGKHNSTKKHQHYLANQ